MTNRTLVWILVSFSFLSLSVRSHPPKSPETNVQAWDPEYEFVSTMTKLCVLRNGKRYLQWPAARAASKRNEDLTAFSREIHKQVHKSKRYMKVKDASFQSATITFLHEELKPMAADIIKFKVFRNERLGIGYRWFYVTRGPREDCVYYLWLISEPGKVYQVGSGHPICGIRWNPRWKY